MSQSDKTYVLRETTEQDFDEVMRIIGEAREAIRALNIRQWTDGYPSPEQIANDMENGWSYVLVDENNTIVGTQAVSFDGEPVYEKVYEGDWVYEGPYATVHRVAVDPAKRGRGLAGLLFAGAEALAVARQINIVRVDTHEGNLPMRKALERAGYEYRGFIYLADGAPRVAYEKLINA